MDFTQRRLTPYFISLTEDACIYSFHRKKTFSRFIAIHNPSAHGVRNYTGNTTKREYIEEIFGAIIDRNDKLGHSFIYNIAKSLTEMKSFPDLKGWEESPLMIERAYKAVEALKIEFDKLSTVDDEELKIRERQKAHKHESKILIEKQDKLNSIIHSLDRLLQDIGSQKAGYAFQDWFYDLADYYEIQNRRPYVDSHKRQIDGSITINGTNFLVETKFTTGPTGSEDIDIFLSKIQRKADNTMGILLSISGFNENAKKNASRDRTPLLLMDHSHLYNIIFQGVLGLDETIERILRHASQTGDSFLPANQF